MLRSAIDWHSTSLKMLFEVSMLVAPAVDWRISRRCASKPRKNRSGFTVAGLLQDEKLRSEMGRNARRMAMGYSVDAMAHRFAEGVMDALKADQ